MLEWSSRFILGYMVLVCQPDWITCPVDEWVPPHVCSVKEPCTCMYNHLTCVNAGLTSVPDVFVDATIRDFRRVGFQHYTVDLSHNSITELDSEAFLNFTSISHYMYQIDVNLRDNIISYVDVDAFAGLGYNVTLLDLRNNNISYIPEALETLHSIDTLMLSGNPLRSMSSTAVYYVARTVTILSISMALFEEWPVELKYFESLEFLTVDHCPFSELPLNAFQGLESSLTKLTLDATSLHRLPSAICNVQQSLRWLFYRHNNHIQLPLFEDCHRFTKLTLLDLSNNGLQQLPDFPYLPSLQHINLGSNNLSAVDWSRLNKKMRALTLLDLSDNCLQQFPDVLPSLPSLIRLNLSSNSLAAVNRTVKLLVGHQLQELYMTRNDLRAFPSWVFQLKRLDSLDLSYNQIHSIKAADFDDAGITILHLDLSDNPLEYIADNAFRNKTLLRIMDLRLSFTNLTSVPRALIYIYIKELYIRGCPIVCSCKLSYLEGLYDFTSINSVRYIKGTCANTGGALSTFINRGMGVCHNDLKQKNTYLVQEIIGK